MFGLERQISNASEACFYQLLSSLGHSFDFVLTYKKALHHCNSFHPLCTTRIVCVFEKATVTPTSQRIGIRIYIWPQQRVSGNVVCKLNYMAVSLSLYRSMTEWLSGRFCKLSKISIMSITYSDSVNQALTRDLGPLSLFPHLPIFLPVCSQHYSL